MRKRECEIGAMCYYGTVEVRIMTLPQPNYTIGISYMEGADVITLTVFINNLTKEPNYEL